MSDGFRPDKGGARVVLAPDPGHKAHKVAGRLKRASCKGAHRTTIERGRASGVRHYRSIEQADMMDAIRGL